MQLMSDALAVLGSRHGLIFEPLQHRCRLLRFSCFDEAPEFGLRAGLRIGEREVIFPLASVEGADSFTLLDQRMTPTSWSLKGIDKPSGLVVTLKVACPFRAGDADFSTAPVLIFDMTVRKLGGHFRWTPKATVPEKFELFLEIADGPFRQERGTRSVDLLFEAMRTMPDSLDGSSRKRVHDFLPQRDRLSVLEGKVLGTRFCQMMTAAGAETKRLRVAWSTWSRPALMIGEQASPFRYTKNFASLTAVTRWAKAHAEEIFSEAEIFAKAARAPVGGAAMDHLLAYTLHSWLVNTWWTLQPGGKDWFSVWEGNCYFHSTVDVEFTQAPFYLLWWPELLGLEIDQWTNYAKSAEGLLGDAGKGASFLAHDVGWGCRVGVQYYPHEMEIEETANWILLLQAHAARTGQRKLIRQHQDVLARFTRFLLAADTDGDGIPDRGVANTIDDGSPAIQYGTQQTYLAVKTLAALCAASEMLGRPKHAKLAGEAERASDLIARKIAKHGWAQDHFTVLLEKSGDLKNPWTGEMMNFAQIPGWDAPHIYTANTLPILDLAGAKIPVSEKRIRQDLQVATERCLRAYGCTHTDFQREDLDRLEAAATEGLAGAAQNPGWISMNMLRDLAALKRGIDLTPLAQRYWDWQVLVNTQGTGLFFETFGGNNLHFYPRGIAIWGIFGCVGHEEGQAGKGR